MDNNRFDSEQGALHGEPQSAIAPGVNLARRRLFRGAGGGAGVLLAVSAKSALGGGVCRSPSAIMSGNTSPRPASSTVCSGGRSPGFWVQPQHSPYWAPAGATFPQVNGNIVTCSTALQKVVFTDITNQGTSLQSVFPGWTCKTQYQGSVSLWWVLNAPNDAIFGGAAGSGQLLRHLTAAWLNAGYFTSNSTRYPMTKAQVVDMWTQLSKTGMYCPGSMKCSKPWSPAEVIAYISGMYDDNAAVDNLCKQ
jgi:hypothetical protein